MTVLVIGLGSMGKRRIRLLKQIDSTLKIVGVDSNQERCNDVESTYGIISYKGLDEAFQEQCDCAFVCTSPLSHASLIKHCLSNGLHTFTEINLVLDGYDENIALAKEKGVVLFLSSTFLYRKEVHFIKKSVSQAQSKLTYSYHVGQYLPDWHPWESYTDYFVGNRRTNGCREFMAIDFPWLYSLFGSIIDVQVKTDKKTLLKTDYNDSYLLLVQHDSGTQGTILVDVVSRKAVRNLEVFGEDLYLTWDGSAEGLKKYDIPSKEEKTIKLYDDVDRQKGYASFVVENAYKSEIEAFFNQIDKGLKVQYGFEEDKQVLTLINKIEEDKIR